MISHRPIIGLYHFQMFLEVLFIVCVEMVWLLVEQTDLFFRVNLQLCILIGIVLEVSYAVNDLRCLYTILIHLDGLVAVHTL